jgi:hypothetical protein
MAVQKAAGTFKSDGNHPDLSFPLILHNSAEKAIIMDL